MYICIYVCVCMYVCVYVCMCVWGPGPEGGSGPQGKSGLVPMEHQTNPQSSVARAKVIYAQAGREMLSLMAS